MKIKYVFICVFLVMMASGCNLLKPITTSTITTESATTTTEYVPVDTVVYVPQTNSKLEITLEKLLESQERMTNTNGRSSVSIAYDPIRNTITADCECDSAGVKLRLYKEITTRLVERLTETKKTVTEKEPFLDRMGDSVLLMLLGAFIVFGALYYFKN